MKDHLLCKQSSIKHIFQNEHLQTGKFIAFDELKFVIDVTFDKEKLVGECCF